MICMLCSYKKKTAKNYPCFRVSFGCTVRATSVSIISLRFMACPMVMCFPVSVSKKAYERY